MPLPDIQIEEPCYDRPSSARFFRVGRHSGELAFRYLPDEIVLELAIDGAPVTTIRSAFGGILGASELVSCMQSPLGVIAHNLPENIH